MKTSAIWISYDLGIQGDYPSLYSWLDAHEAQECGDAFAFLKFAHRGPLKESLKEALEQAIVVNARTRIYVIYRETDAGKSKGTFLFGGRRAPPWTGYAPSGPDTIDEES
ncbi:MAG: hypothetical protein JWQ11_4853 [Rhizobacter sp.]|jgi:hypothetical protein|nr:hypothetical protein [Rhizobacter sp.]